MTPDHLAAVRRRVAAFPRDELVGCEETDIEALEAQVGLRLPDAHRQYLRLMGRESGRILWGCGALIDELPTTQRLARVLMRQHGHEAAIPPGAFFIVFNGYHALLFECDGNPDPPVRSYLEGEPDAAQLPRTFARFSDFLLSMLNE